MLTKNNKKLEGVFIAFLPWIALSGFGAQMEVNNQLAKPMSGDQVHFQEELQPGGEVSSIVSRLRKSSQDQWVYSAKDDEFFENYQSIQSYEDDPKNSFDLHKYITDKWLVKGKNLLLLLGSSGSGKSSYGFYLERELWNRYKDKNDYLPIYIKLTEFYPPKEPGKMIEETLIDRGLEKREIKVLKNSMRVLFFLDGYDEIRDYGRIELNRNLYTQEELHRWKRAKVIITSRSETSKDDDTVAPSQTSIYLTPLNEGWIQEFVEQQGDAKQGHAELQELGLLPLIKTPQAAIFGLDVLKKNPTSRYDAYTAFFKAWNKDGGRRARVSGYPGTANDFQQKVGKYTRNLALKMFEQGVSEVSPKTQEGTDDPVWKEFFSEESRPYRAVSMLQASRDEKYTLIDPSVLDFLVAQKIAIDLTEGKFDSLSRKILTPQILEFVVQRVKGNKKLEKTLKSGLKSNTSEVHFMRMNVNIMTIINKAKFSFRGMDLNGLQAWVQENDKLRGPDLSFADFQGTNLRAADLRGSNLSGADLQNVNFNGTNLDSANLSGSKTKGAKFEYTKLHGTQLPEDLKGAKVCKPEGVDVKVVTDKGAEDTSCIIM